MFEPHLSILCWDATKAIDGTTKPKEWYLEKETRATVLDTVIHNNDELRLLYAKIGYRPIDHYDHYINSQLNDIKAAIDDNSYRDNRFRSRSDLDDQSGQDRFLDLLDNFSDIFRTDHQDQVEDNNYLWSEEDKLLISNVPAK